MDVAGSPASVPAGYVIAAPDDHIVVPAVETAARGAAVSLLTNQSHLDREHLVRYLLSRSRGAT